MKRVIVILLLLLFTIQCVGATDTYNIQHIKNLETSIPMQEPIKTYIDYRDIDEATNGGYVGNGEYVFPNDLGLGKHQMKIVTSKGITYYDFYVVKNDEDVSIYDGYTPYYYNDDVTDDVIEEDYNTFIYPYKEDDDIIAENNLVDENNIEKIIVSIDPKMYLFDKTLTNGEII